MIYTCYYISCSLFISYFNSNQIIKTGEEVAEMEADTLLGVIIASLVSVVIFLIKWSLKQQEDRKKEFEKIFNEEREEIKRLKDVISRLESKQYDTFRDHSKMVQKMNKEHSEKIEKLITDYKGTVMKFNNSIENLIEAIKERSIIKKQINE